jgi:hypothetical protein
MGVLVRGSCVYILWGGGNKNERTRERTCSSEIVKVPLEAHVCHKGAANREVMGGLLGVPVAPVFYYSAFPLYSFVCSFFRSVCSLPTPEVSIGGSVTIR